MKDCGNLFSPFGGGEKHVADGLKPRQRLKPLRET